MSRHPTLDGKKNLKTLQNKIKNSQGIRKGEGTLKNNNEPKSRKVGDTNYLDLSDQATLNTLLVS